MTSPQNNGTFICSRSSQLPQPQIKITPEGNACLVQFPFNAAVVYALKSRIPQADRAWDKGRKLWRIGNDSIETLCLILEENFGGRVIRPQLITQQQQIESKTIDLIYLGLPKERAITTKSSYGWDGANWSIEIPEKILRDFFNNQSEQRPDEQVTLYGVLLVKTSSPDAEIKSAYRRLARQWHPDVCREPNAADEFRKIQQAWDVLSDPMTRKKYDAGLALAETSSNHLDRRRTWAKNSFIPPLRCGRLQVEGMQGVARFTVSRILRWDDIEQNGKIMISNWNMETQVVEILWL